MENKRLHGICNSKIETFAPDNSFMRERSALKRTYTMGSGDMEDSTTLEEDASPKKKGIT